ncbi:MAG: zinc-binding dehydrogenase [Armatimonadota bacterium]
MSTETRAVISTSPGKTEFGVFQMPDPCAGEVQVRTDLSTISVGTEGWVLQNKFTWAATVYPNVPGYQRVGTVVACGDGVTDWKPGDRCMATVGCWQGSVVPFWGSHGEILNTRASELYRIPNGVDDIDASGLVVAQVGYNAAFRPTLSAGDWVVVYGDGLIGQSGAQAARARGAKVILVGHRPERLELAAKHSADYVISSHDCNSAEEARKIIGGCANVVIDTVQNESCQTQYLPLLEYAKGQIVYSGFTPGTAWADMGRLQQMELTTHFVAGWTRERMESTLNLMAEGKMCIKPLITHHMPAQNGPEAYDMIIGKSKSFLGITLDWRNLD